MPRLYEAGAYSPLWIGDGLKQAKAALSLLQEAEAHGLARADYQVDAISAQLNGLTPANSAEVEIALSTAVMQYLGDLRFGRLKSGFAAQPEDARLVAFDPVEQIKAAIKANGVAQLSGAAEPPFPLYRRVMTTLGQYRQLASANPDWQALPPIKRGKKLVAGTPYEGAPTLRARLALFGDLPAGAAPEKDDAYTAELSDALKRFQSRHGLEEDGTLGPATMKALAVPPDQRARQLALTLERLRVLPQLRPGRTIAVNLPSYRLWAFDSTTKAEPLEMRVIVGTAVKTQTPLFIGQMRYLEFNPYWNVPRSIELGEIIPKLASNPRYLEENDMELVSRSGGKVETVGADGALEAIKSARVRVRQRPGEQNVLGAVKFAMPNSDNIYLHSTSAPQLFSRARRDLSHGCIRVERPVELAAFVLGDAAQWSQENVEAAMQPGPLKTVKLKEVIPVVLFYATAMSDQTGRALFSDDIYKLDPKLELALQMRK
ncbi:murein L,D-transpeptidase [Massilia glaciei]|uniref:Murein L,D-transpeptidase n=1 Tax=Massilia glaciei TaxID=1524097 RepID=A0A2U2HM65_9BURK|nr:murein L,D-transpeptidase [Massilia glaciei]